MSSEKGCSTGLADAQSFGDFVKSNYRAVYGVAFSTVGDWTAAEDIAQETFLLAWENRAEIRRPEAFPAWIRKIARNLGKNWIRSLVYRRRLRERYAETSAHRDSVRVRSERTGAEQREEVFKALRTLSPRLREVVVAYYLEGKSVRDASLGLGCSESAVKKRLERARGQLRAYFEALWMGEMEEERRRLNAEEAKARFLGGMASGPVGGVFGAQAVRGGWRLLAHAIAHREASGVVKAGVCGAPLKAAGAGVVAVGLAGVGIVMLSSPPQKSLDRSLEVEALAAGSLEGGSASAEEDEHPGLGTEGLLTAQGVQKDAADLGVTPSPLVPHLGGRVCGLVVDEEGAAIPGAEVSLRTPRRIQAWSASASPREPELPAHLWRGADEDGRGTKTDARGAFMLGSLPPGKDMPLRVCADGFSCEEVTLRASAESSDGVTRVALSPAVFLEGLVLGVDGAPLAGASVRAVCLLRAGTNGMVSGAAAVGSPSGAGVVCDNQGRFRLPLRSYGEVTLQVERQDLGKASFSGVVATAEAMPVLRFPLLAGVRGKVRWADGADGSGCRILLSEMKEHGLELRGEGERSLGGMGGVGWQDSYRAETDGEGSFILSHVDPGQRYTVSILDPSGMCVESQVPLPALSPGSVIVWEHMIPQGSLLEGTVRDPVTGDPVGGVDVVCRRLKAGSERPGVVSTGSDGKYSFHFPGGTGEYCLAPRYHRAGTGYRPAAEDEFTQVVSIQDRGTESIDLSLPTSVSRTFRVVTERDEPVAECSVCVFEHWNGAVHGWLYPARTDGDGRIVVEGLAPVPELCCVFSSGKVTGRSRLVRGAMPNAGASSEETVVLYPPAGVCGELLDSSGSPLANARFVAVAMWDDGAQRRLAGVTTATGEFLFDSELPATLVNLVFEVEHAGESVLFEADSIPCSAGQVIDLGVLKPDSGQVAKTRSAS